MHLHKFEVVDCCGSHCEYVELEVSDDFDFYDQRYDLLNMAGYRNYTCESCYDAAYRLVDCGPVSPD